ncbi:hypothetical protein MNBD_NITROSPINAE04-584 [hydrothermal vent metagenome]|uniref:Radical SAM core domain-containing protein n=2 Tax=hydrothermal vent metagenome TaxID=652676 RepID=A0A3B1CBZ0_9ZZZZ
MKIVTANCVGIDSDGWFIIPYPSRWTTSAKDYSDAFTYYPKDLGYLTSLLKQNTNHKVKLVDACLDRQNKEEYAERIIKEKPDWLVMESSTRTFNEDIWVAQKVKKEIGTKIMMTGQHPSAFADETSKHCDVVIKGEYLAPALHFFNHGGNGAGSGVIDFDKAHLMDVSQLPFPEDDDVSRYDYALKADPICRYREIQLYTSRGCPYGCVFCVASHTYYGGPDWRPRPVNSIIDEMRFLYEKYPQLEGMFFDDEIHNASIKRIKQLSKAIVKAGFDDRRYNAMCAYHTFDRESLELMKRAGYYLVRVGIETASDKVAEGLNLRGKYRPAKLEKFLNDAKQIGMEVYGTFTVGGPESSRAEDRKTIRLMEGLIEDNYLSDCQISICTPQPGAPFYEWAVKRGALSEKTWSEFDGGVSSVLSLPGYSGESIEEIRREALTAYDRARSVRDKQLFQNNWNEQSDRIGPAPEKLLIFRSSRDWHLRMLLEAVGAKWPGADIAMLCHEKFIASYKDTFPRLKYIPYSNEGFLNVERLGESSLAAMKKFDPDTALIPSNVYHCRGYGNVALIAEKLKVESSFFVNSLGLIRPASS